MRGAEKQFEHSEQQPQVIYQLKINSMIAKMSWRNLIKGVPTVFNCGCKVPKRVLPNLWIMSETDLRTKS